MSQSLKSKRCPACTISIGQECNVCGLCPDCCRCWESGVIKISAVEYQMLQDKIDILEADNRALSFVKQELLRILRGKQLEVKL